MYFYLSFHADLTPYDLHAGNRMTVQAETLGLQQTLVTVYLCSLAAKVAAMSSRYV